MTTADFLFQLRSLDVELWADGERLRCNAPKEVLTPELWAELKDRKQEILVFLRETNGAAHSSMPPLQVVSRDGDLPPSFAQQRLWFLDQLEPNSPLYNIPTAVRISGSLNVEALRKAFNAIVSRHEVLRTTFAAMDGIPVQVIAPSDRPAEFKMIDLTHVSADGREEEVQRLLREEFSRSFNLSSDLMLRATLLKRGQEEHVLLLVIHHIASDGWSMGVLFRELAALYETLSAGKPSTLPELPIQYADFAVWQRQWLQGDILESHLRYWKRQLADAPPILELPTDRPRPPVQSYRGARQSLWLAEAANEALKSLSRREGVTLFMTLLAAFKVLLHRYTGQDDIVVGSPVASRNRVEIEPLMGFFVNTLILRTDISGDPNFRELLGRVRDTALGAYAHQDLPFEKLVEELQPKRALDHHPLFQVMFAVENGPSQVLSLAGLTTLPLGAQNDTAKFDLTLFMTDTGKELIATLEYNTDLFDWATISRMLGHFQILLEGIAANPEQRLSDLPMLTEAERHQLLIEWSDTKTDYPHDECIHQLFEAQVERSPDAVAVVFEDKQLTYRELNRRANQLAHHLQNIGVGPEMLVGICMERTLEMVIGLLGILKAGGAYVPLDPGYPKERLAFMLQDAQVPVLLTQADLAKGLPDHAAQVLYLDSDWDMLTRESTENPASVVNPENLAYVIYTSGSTGQPKGALNTHKGICNRLLWMQGAYRLTQADRVLQKTPFSFDVSVWEFFWPLLTGARLVVARPGGHQDSAYLAKLIAEHKITTIHFVPSMLQVFIEEPGVEENCVSLKRVICSGEALPSALQERFFNRLDAELHNLYGPTEAAVDATFWACERESNRSTIPIGHPIANTQIYILDSHLQPVPVGVPGELHIGGVGVARGYLNRPELTAEQFIAHPFSTDPGARLFKTGDLGRYLPDGNIEFLGRIDHQVKIRGFRIELGEIEAVLCQHPNVRETVVVMREHVPDDKQLVAYVVPSHEPAPTTRELRAFLQQKLPDYMIPSVFVFLESLPVTPNGKIDRRALPVSNQERFDNGSDYEAPVDALEYQLVQIWEHVLPVRPIGSRDNFFELGGHSLLALRMFMRLEEYLRIRIPLATLFQAPTIEGLAKVIRDSGRLQPSSLLVAIQPAGSRPPIFAVPGVGGNVHCYYDLGRLMAPEQPFYGLQSGVLSATEKPLTSIEEIAAAFLREIREVQPEGPYYLVGACMGGVVAYEMAQQLRAAGQEVGLLVLLETWLPVTTSERRLRLDVRTLAALNFIVGRLRLYVHTLARLRGRQRLNYLLGRLKKLTNIVAQRDVLLGNRSEFYIEVATQANLIAFQQYAPRAYPGRGVLFCAEGRRVSPHNDRRLAWGHLIEGGLEIHNVPGDDSGLILTEPHVRVLAHQLKACVERAQQLAAMVKRT